MLKERARTVAAGLRALDLGAVALAHPAADAALGVLGALGAGGPAPGAPADAARLGWTAAALVAWSAAASAARLYAAYRTASPAEELRRAARAAGGFALLLAAATFAADGAGPSRGLVLAWSLAALAGVAAARVAIRAAARAARRRGYNTRRFAVVGAGPLAARVRDALLARPEWGFRFAGWIGLPGEPEPDPGGGGGGGGGEGEGVLGAAPALAAVLEREPVDLVVFAVPRDRLAEVEPAVRACDELGVPVKIALDLFPRGAARPAVEELDGLPLLALASAPSDGPAVLAKRAFDLTASALALLALAPLLASIALAVRATSPGPVLFRQRRLGLHGRPFTLLKFRTMHLGAEALLPALAARNEADGPVFKLRDDPRVTRLGRLLRRASLDELPQLWNVLRGEMSVVGPRPPLPSEVRAYARWQRRRLSVKPGLTCTWQVSGRSDVGFDRWMEMDLAYIDGWSLWTDLAIVARTIPAVLLGRGAR